MVWLHGRELRRHRLSGLKFAAAAGGLVLAAYTLTLFVANDLTPLDALIAGAANTAPTMLFGLAAWRVIVSRVVARGPASELFAHAVLATLFCLLSYWLLMILLASASAASLIAFEVRPFPSRATAWQLLQNLTVYGALATHAYWYARAQAERVTASDAPAGGAPSPALRRYFIRVGDEIRPIDADSIISIAGADDYAEVVTATGKHLARMTLTEFESVLDPTRFYRVHRSWIINIAKINRAEPAGNGRMLLHMADGDLVQTSRAGARRLREHLL